MNPKITYDGKEFTGNSFVITVSREMALDYGMVEPTPEEAAERAASMAAFLEQQERNRQQFLVAIAGLRGRGGLTAALLDLHAPDLDADYLVECPGCDFSGYEGEPPSWPCRTIELLADHHGIEIPEGQMPGKRYEGDA